MWDHHSARIRHAVQRKLQAEKDWSPDDFNDALDGLGDALVNENAYKDAVNAGRKAVPGTPRDDHDPVVDIWVARVRKYGDQVPGRVAQHLAEAATSGNDQSADAIAARIDAKLNALRSSITRYAEPPWGAGQQAYGEQLAANDVLLVWELGDDEDHCADCLQLAAGSPYEKGDVPAWPGDGNSVCLDRCHCSIVADEQTWAEAFGQAA